MHTPFEDDISCAIDEITALAPLRYMTIPGEFVMISRDDKRWLGHGLDRRRQTT